MVLAQRREVRLQPGTPHLDRAHVGRRGESVRHKGPRHALEDALHVSVVGA